MNELYATLVRCLGDGKKPLALCRQLHAHIARNGHTGDAYLSNLLIEMYGKCGGAEEALAAFEDAASTLWRRNIFSWNLVISACARNGRDAQALSLFQRLREEEGCRFPPDKFTFLPALAACANLRDLREGRILHSTSASTSTSAADGRKSMGDASLKTALLTFYGKCGCIDEAYRIFRSIPCADRDVPCWNAMIAAHAHSFLAKEDARLYRSRSAQFGHPKEAQSGHFCEEGEFGQFYRVGQFEYGNEVIFGYAKGAQFGHLKDAQSGYAEVDQSGQSKETQLGHLKDFQFGHSKEASFGRDRKGQFSHFKDARFGRSREVQFEHDRDSWFRHSQDSRFRHSQDSQFGHFIDAQSGLGKEIQVGDDKVAQFRHDDADQVQHIQNSQFGHDREGQFGFDEEGQFGHSKDAQFGHLKEVQFGQDEEGRFQHSKDAQFGYDKEVQSGHDKDALTKLGHGLNAHFRQDEDTMFGHGKDSQSGHGEEALAVFWEMVAEAVKPNRITLICVLEACASLLSIDHVRPVHRWIGTSELKSDIVVNTALLNVYVKWGNLKEAREVFDRMPQRDVVSWNMMVVAYIRDRKVKNAVELFQTMDFGTVTPDKSIVLRILDACASPPYLDHGRAVHHKLIGSILETDVVVSTALLDMYSKCRSLREAYAVFDEMRERNVITWNAMIAACTENGHPREALVLYNQMDAEGIEPDNVTFLAVLDTCGRLESLVDGRAIHNRIDRSRYGSDYAVVNALLNMYGKCGSPKEARSVFDGMPWRDVVAWTSMITAYARNGEGKPALEAFRRMGSEGIMPDRIAFLSILDVCACISSLEHGRAIHELVRACGLDSDITVMNALFNMYGKCGSLMDSRILFDQMESHDVISWNTMITAYAHNGHSKEALELFRHMDLQGRGEEGVHPDRVTFISILNACSKAGLVDDGCCHFLSMIGLHHCLPTLDHYLNMVDLLGRAGRLEEAEDLLTNMPVQSDEVAWLTLLGACQIHGDVERARRAARISLELNPTDELPYAMLSDMYVATRGGWMRQAGEGVYPYCGSVEQRLEN